MAWSWRREQAERIELEMTRWRDRLLTAAPTASEPTLEDDLRLFPIVEADLCYPVASLLARGKLEDAGRLVPDRAWVASTPMYG